MDGLVRLPPWRGAVSVHTVSFITYQNAMINGFTDTRPMRTLPRNIVSTLPWSVELRGLPGRRLFTFCTVTSASNLSRNCAIVTVLLVVIQIRFFNVFASLSHSPFSSNTYESTYVAQMLTAVPPFCFTLYNAI